MGSEFSHHYNSVNSYYSYDFIALKIIINYY